MRRLLAVALLATLAGCSSPTAPQDMTGSWGVEGGAGQFCAFFAFADLNGDADAIRGTATLVSENEAGLVGVAGNRDWLRIGQMKLRILRSEDGVVRGTFDCRGAPGAWSMVKYPNDGVN